MSGPRILAIETSCDETGVAVVVGGRRIEANQVATQVALHAATGGIVPEVAARQQLRWIVPTLEAAMDEANADWGDLDAVAVTYGPGLIGSLLVGVNLAKALAVAHDLPLVGVNHIEGHIYANWLTDAARRRAAARRSRRSRCSASWSAAATRSWCSWPTTAATRCSVRRWTTRPARRSTRSGGCSTCRIPGGPAISAAAEGATPATRFPRARTGGAYDFSFSGLKTAVLREVAGYRERGEPIPVDGLAAAFEEAVVDALATKTVAAAARPRGRRRSRWAAASPPTARCARRSTNGSPPTGCRCSCRRRRGAPTTAR